MPDVAAYDVPRLASQPWEIPKPYPECILQTDQHPYRTGRTRAMAAAEDRKRATNGIWLTRTDQLTSADALLWPRLPITIREPHSR